MHSRMRFYTMWVSCAGTQSDQRGVTPRIPSSVSCEPSRRPHSSLLYPRERLQWPRSRTSQVLSLTLTCYIPSDPCSGAQPEPKPRNHRRGTALPARAGPRREEGLNTKRAGAPFVRFFSSSLVRTRAHRATTGPQPELGRSPTWHGHPARAMWADIRRRLTSSRP